jgi:leader peptidase (prepilin peptidase)/N-methyltransferase
LIGSFLNVVVYRLPLMLQRHWQREAEQFLQGDANLPHSSGDTFNLAVPASHCPHCHHAIRWWQNIPLLSYCLLAGRCRYCQAAIPLRYPLIELLTAASFAVLAWQLDNILALSLAGIFTAALLALAAIDIEHQLLLDAITLPLLWLGLIVNSFGLWVPLPAALWGAVGGYLSLWCVYWIYKLITGRDGIGFGDMKLLAALGAWLGWQALPAVAGATDPYRLALIWLPPAGWHYYGVRILIWLIYVG